MSENPAFRASGVESSFKKELNLMEFYNELKSNCHGKPYVYHFTHLFNAIEVIRTRKILSRNRAKELGLLKYDAAVLLFTDQQKHILMQDFTIEQARRPSSIMNA